MKAALSGVRVLDCTSALAGPYCARLLADLGAEVIKIEPPNGCLFRQSQMYSMYNGESYALMMIDANKKFVRLDLKTPEGKQVFRELLAKSDVLIDNHAPGTMKKLVGSYEDMKSIRPDLIYCQVTAFGMTGPLNNLSGYAWTAEARSGIMEMEGFPEGPPVTDGVAFVDTMTGAFAALSVLAALHHRTNRRIRSPTK